ncbi:hypothetical protein [Ruminiclostridium cellobioparum]|uniref:hypothetical protein n=1 Tax=Ruminiclostridium cellobioparum TaxID=29355 RepID=UPI001FA79C8A|nr:hypothetical protein [Ruminiclostridium cellobioparum]
MKDIDLSSGTDQTVLIFKANRPLTVQEHEELSHKLRYEEENTGLKIVLVPFLLDVTDGDQDDE